MSACAISRLRPEWARAGSFRVKRIAPAQARRHCGAAVPERVCGRRPLRSALTSVSAPVLFAVVAAAATASPPEVFEVQGRRPDHAVITADESTNAAVSLDTAMEKAVAGVLDVHDARTIGRLLRCATRTPMTEEAAAHGQRIAVLALSRRGAPAVKAVEVLRLADGSIGARPITPGARGILLRRSRFEELAAGWNPYRGGFDPQTPAGPVAESFALTPPYVPGRITLDAATQRQRLYRGLAVRTEDPDRELDRETFHARLPAGYDPRYPAGLVVWSSPSPRGVIPCVLGPALDELNLICVGSDNTGNQRDVPDKFQLVFDAVATAGARFHLDERRIYVAGMSGGGKVGSILAMCFPEVFAGAVAIVGFGSHSALDDSWGEHRSPYFAKPRGRWLRLARAHRMALMGGPLDFNFREMQARQALLEADGFANIRFFSYPDMAHVMPTASRFSEAIRWVDEPYRRARRAEAAEASSALSAYRRGRGQAAPASDADREALRRVIETAPWSEAAWEALDLLRAAGA